MANALKLLGAAGFSHRSLQSPWKLRSARWRPWHSKPRASVSENGVMFIDGVEVDESIAGFITRINECNCGKETADKLLEFKVCDASVGFVTPGFAGHLSAFPDTFHVKMEEKNVLLNPSLTSFEERTKAVGGVMQILRERGVLSGWRNEMYPVTEAFHKPPLLLVERTASVNLGVRAYGVHINGYSFIDGKMHMWVAKRSRDKPTWPGKLDHIVAGGQPHGIGCMENVVKECSEEAGIPDNLAKQAKPCGAVSYSTMQENGLKRDVLFVYDLELPSNFQPLPQDGEVESFSLRPVEEVMEIIRTTVDYKPNCALVVIDFLVRHGFISPDQSGYLQLVAGLRSSDCM